MCYVGVNSAPAGNDTLYIIIVPKTHIFINNNLLFGVISGYKKSTLDVEIHTDVPNMKTFLTANRKKYATPQHTNPIIDKLESLGYTFKYCGSTI